MEATFDIYISGDLRTGFSKNEAVAGLSRLFSVDEQAAQVLLDGRAHRVKAKCSKGTALKYREALGQIGIGVTITRTDADAAATRTTADEGTPPITATEKPSPAHFTATDTVSAGGGGVDWQPTDAPPVDSAELTLAPVGSIIGDDRQDPDYKLAAVPDFEVADAGELIPTVSVKKDVLTPRVDHLHLEPLTKD